MSRRVRGDSGYSSHLDARIVDAEGRLHVPETALSAGETNYVRVAGEGTRPSPYSDAISIGYDPSVTDQSANQVDALAVSRVGTEIVLRWRVLQDSGREFRVWFTRAVGGKCESRG